jgi:hypothetical protein
MKRATMANSNSSRSRKTGTRQVTHFDEVRGKTVEFVELSLDTENYSIEIRFSDKTALIFDMEPEPGLRVTPDLADWKTGDWKPMKRWRPLHSR